MEIFGGFMVMMSILGFFLAVIWLIMPFVVFAIKGKLDRAVDLLTVLDERLSTIESRLDAIHSSAPPPAPPADDAAADAPSAPLPLA